MALPWLDRIGDWNPQLFRELKGRLNVRNIAIAIGTSLLGQVLLILYWLSQLPKEPYSIWDRYCRLRAGFESSSQQVPQLQTKYARLQSEFAHYSGAKHYDPVKVQELKVSIESVKEKLKDLQKVLSNNICPADAIDYQGWWQDHYPKMFVSLSLFVLFTLLVVGCYMLISDLAREERRGTLNFIRLSPQSTWSILRGKLLGVPILLYLAAILTLPLSVGLGLTAQIPLGEIFSFWAVLVASCAFFYSAALLFGLVSSWLGGFQPWLGSGAVLVFLFFANAKPIEQSPVDWFKLFNPSVLLPYLVDRTGSYYTDFPFYHGVIKDWEWFHFPLGTIGISVVIFTVLNYAIGTYWIGQALNRRFRNPNATTLSKRQSYVLVACFSVV
ncbi:MAG: ABC transporter permease, partial [Coleofasciculus sp. S288]|nr:ABC transporter permease [Coleofasciculus sp. S288]